MKRRNVCVCVSHECLTIVSYQTLVLSVAPRRQVWHWQCGKHEILVSLSFPLHSLPHQGPLWWKCSYLMLPCPFLLAKFSWQSSLYECKHLFIAPFHIQYPFECSFFLLHLFLPFFIRHCLSHSFALSRLLRGHTYKERLYESCTDTCKNVMNVAGVDAPTEQAPFNTSFREIERFCIHWQWEVVLPDLCSNSTSFHFFLLAFCRADCPSLLYWCV